MSAWRRGPRALLFGLVLLLARLSSALRHQGQIPSPVINNALEKEVVILLFWADKTHIAAFGKAQDRRELEASISIPETLQAHAILNSIKIPWSQQ
jgi:hypothetical protein